MAETVSVAVMGHGVVGSGVVEVILNHKESISAKIKKDICLKRILDLREFSNLPYSNLFTKNFDDILNDDSVDIVVEVMGGVHPAYDFVKSCLLKGKSVATSNKELVAAKGAELLKIAEENNVNFLFEASVGGGIPVLRPMAQCLSANDLYEVFGILNGTTNFILTKMINENMSFDDALKLAQQLGYAEKEPSADVDGHDTCRKICILASLAFGKHVYPNQVKTEGIRKVSLLDVEYATSADCVIKLVGHTKLMDDGKISAEVYPALISKDNQLSSVDDVFNAIMVRGDAVGDVMFYGRGAGKLPTASAVVADVMDCAKHLYSRKYLSWDEGSEDYVIPAEFVKSKYYLRGNILDESAAKSEIENLFGDVAYLSREGAQNEIAFITKAEPFGEFEKKVAGIQNITELSVLHVLD